MKMDEKKVILKIRNLSKDFKIKSRKLSEKPQILHALSNVSLDVYEGETIVVQLSRHKFNIFIMNRYM